MRGLIILANMIDMSDCSFGLCHKLCCWHARLEGLLCQRFSLLDYKLNI
jgi:hypothetical protein